MYRFAAAAIALLLAPLPAAAQTWLKMPEVQEATYGFVNTDSMRTEGDLITATSLSVTMPMVPGTQIRWMLLSAEYRCADRHVHVVNIKAFNTERKLIANIDDIDEGQFRAVAPNTVSTSIIDYICGVNRAGTARVDDPWTVLPPAAK